MQPPPFAALAEDPRNLVAVRLLARAIAQQLASSHHRPAGPAAAVAAGEIGELCRQYPVDAEMQAAFAVVLSLSDRALKAANAFDRVQRLGGRPEQFLHPADVRTIREAAATEWTTRFWQSMASSRP